MSHKRNASEILDTIILFYDGVAHLGSAQNHHADGALLVNGNCVFHVPDDAVLCPIGTTPTVIAAIADSRIELHTRRPSEALQPVISRIALRCICRVLPTPKS